ncbi:ArdC-like ssDNA-binding domain-containing protein [Rathayibacter sp. AY1F3]|uniref:ArdC-like ssDNA-binding domain-containing protein n=1 Tax=Rathayibacter sp. AY1F3 TaxID=2080558 RepID=UPI0015E43E53|nr:ArdC-like ssDNA-binding domain-containing protein [Rathayibacter sp. AY1F3]
MEPVTERRPAQPSIDVPSNADLLESILTVEGSFGDSYNRFHAYSLRNVGFLAMQGCPPEPVATFKRWQELGYHVKKGERAYSILRPITVKVKGGEGPEPAAEAEHDQPKMMRRFKVVRALFHYAQVAGEGELPPYVPPTWDEARALETLDITEEPFRLFNGNVMGYAYDRTIAVSPVAPYPFKTKMHELGHVVAGHTEDAWDDEDDREAMHQGINEFQAESTAYLALHQLGAEGQMNASESRAYVQHWLRGGEPSEVDVRQVFSATDRIIRAGQISIDPTD